MVGTDEEAREPRKDRPPFLLFRVSQVKLNLEETMGSGPSSRTNAMAAIGRMSELLGL